MREVAKRALADGKLEEVTVGLVWDGYSREGTTMLAEVCEPGFDESRYWTWKTYKQKG